ncbi:MAG: hypothetical protein KGI13_08760 [Betaproteobacteria bacterium]|nr:hypothetical protein [Betaproteobacteria bacterium]
MKKFLILILSVNIIFLLSGCSSYQAKVAEQRRQLEQSNYEWKKQFCLNKGIQPNDNNFNACMNLAQAQLNYNNARMQRCQTNWFGIASAFAKPQLGGFGASLGSANEEMARQKEANDCQ